jgi:hypothetical protein
MNDISTPESDKWFKLFEGTPTAASAYETMQDLERQRDDYGNAYAAIREFCEVEMSWEFFRAEFKISDSPSKSMENARKIQEFLKTLPTIQP